MNATVVVKNGLLVYPEQTLRADIAVKKGLIAAVAAPGELRGEVEIDAEGCYVLPGLVDPHTHPVYLDNMAELSRTAAFGGVTTVIHYAYAKPEQSLVKVIEEYRREGEKSAYADFALHGGLFATLTQAEEIPRAFELGVTSFKMFMSYAKLGWMTDDYAMVKAMDIISRHGGLAALHAENGLAIDYIQDKLLSEKADFAERFLETSPAIAEAEGIFRAVYLGRLMNCPVYIPHVSSEEAVNVMGYLKQRGFPVYAETCPQYLGLTWDQLRARGPMGKVGPSIKTEQDRLALWRALANGLFDTLGSDHAPKDKKADDDFFAAPYGSPQVETLLPVVWQEGVNRGRITVNRLAALAAENPARIFGLYPRKGRLDVGADADLLLFDPAESWTISVDNQHSNTPYTLYEGREILGRVKTVLSRGRIIVEEGEFRGRAGDGRFLPTRAGRTGKS